MAFNEKSGNIVKDSSNYCNNVTIYRATRTMGVINSVLDFDCMDDFVQVLDNKSAPPDYLTTFLTRFNFILVYM